MSDGNQDEILSEFKTVTGINEDRAKFYLESTNWDLQVCSRICVGLQLSESASQCDCLSSN